MFLGEGGNGNQRGVTETSTRAIAAVLLACSISVTAHARSPEALEWVRRSNEALQRGDLAAALEAMQRAWEIDPAPQLANNLGFLLERLGRYDQAAAAYRRVVEDPRAPEELKQKNRERLEALQPKLDAAPLVLTSPSAAITIRVGSLSSDAGADEQLAPPGEALLEIIDRDAKESWLRHVLLPSGRRTELDASIDAASFGTLRFRGAPLGTIRIDDQELHGPPDHALHLEAGPHRIETASMTAERARFDIDVKPLETITLDVIDPPPPSPPPLLPPPAVAEVASPWPYVLWSASVLFVIAGTVLVASAYADIAAIDDGSGISRVSYEEATDLDRRAAIKSPLGIGFLVAGGLSLALGTTWFILD
jgi:tetratricopeptide (TPR) repeat protein